MDTLTHYILRLVSQLCCSTSHYYLKLFPTVKKLFPNPTGKRQTNSQRKKSASQNKTQQKHNQIIKQNRKCDKYDYKYY